MKNRIISALCVVLMICVMSITAYAGNALDMSRRGSVTISMTYDGEPVSGGTLTAYLVADVKIENGADYSFAYTSDYAECEADITDPTKSDLAKELALYTEGKDVEGMKITIDENGKAELGDMKLGLYLFIQEDAAEGYSRVSSFIVTVPGRDGDNYVYDVIATPKVGTMPTPEETTTPEVETTVPEEEPPRLPQTGQNKWPVPVMAVGGTAFVLLGVYFAASSKGKKYES